MRGWVRPAGLALAAAACFGAAHAVSGPLQAERAATGLAPRPIDAAAARKASALSDPAPLLALGIARGLFIDVLWMRAVELQDAGRFHEAIELARLITTLQPRFERIWVFHAWNLAYNVAAATHTGPERWRWAEAGIALLRDRGIPQNPRSARLVDELAWLFHHRVARSPDDLHRYVQRLFALAWHERLGAGADSVEASRGELAPVAEADARFVRGRSAAEARAELMRALPGLALRLQALDGMGWSLDDRLLRALGKLEAIAPAASDQAHGDRLGPPGLLDAREEALLVWWQSAEARWPERERAELMAFLRASALRREHGMDPLRMIALLEAHGPLDWRHGSAHALYWGAVARERAAEDRRATRVAALLRDRLERNSLRALAESGRVLLDPLSCYLDPPNGYCDLLPAPRYVDAYERTLAARGAEGDSATRASHEELLFRAVIWAWEAGEDGAAAEALGRLRRAFGALPGREVFEGAPIDLAMLDARATSESASDPDANSEGVVEGVIARALEHGLAAGDTRRAERLLELARSLYADGVATSAASRAPLAALLDRVVVRFLVEGDAVPLARARVWVRLPDDVRARVYPRVRHALEHLEHPSGYPFPPPDAAPR